MIFLFFFPAPASTEIYTLSLHDALPICIGMFKSQRLLFDMNCALVEFFGLLILALLIVERCQIIKDRSEEHTSELQSRVDLVCRLLLEKKKSQVKKS